MSLPLKLNNLVLLNQYYIITIILQRKYLESENVIKNTNLLIQKINKIINLKLVNV